MTSTRIPLEQRLPEDASPRRRMVRRNPQWWRHLLAIVICLIMIFPIYWMLVTALQPNAELISGNASLFPTHLDFSSFSDALQAYPWAQWFLNTVIVCAASVALSVPTCLLAGYAFAKMRFRGKQILFVLILCTLIMPIQVVMVPLFRLTASMGMYDSLWGVILPLVPYPFGIFLARQYMMSVPDELLEAARVDGAGAIATFFRAVLPLCKPLIAVLVLFNVIYRWTDFAWPLIVLKTPAEYTITVGLLYLQGQYVVNYSQLLGMALLTILPMLVLFAFLQRYFIQGLLRSGIR